jgi:hypothetical protein
VVPQPAKFASKLGEIVDLSVEREPDVLGLVRHRLASGSREIDDREPKVTEDDPLAFVNALAVRAAMALGREHAGQCPALGVTDDTPRSEYSGDTTHGMRNYFSFRS